MALLVRPLARLSVATVLLSFALSACEAPPKVTNTDPKLSGEPALEMNASSKEESDLELVGQSIALALSDSALRMQVLRDMRDSPFRNHSLHLQSYLTGPRGSEIREAAADHVGLQPQELHVLINRFPSLQFFMPIPFQRGTWTGSGPIAVSPLLKSRAEQMQLEEADAWTSDGNHITVPLYEPPEHPLFFVVVSRVAFGIDPEAQRQAAPSLSRETVGEKGWLPEFRPSEYLASITDSPTNEMPSGLMPVRRSEPVAVLASLTPKPSSMARLRENTNSSSTGYTPGSQYLSSDITPSNCTNVVEGTVTVDNQDEDGLKDVCEYELANAFRPRLIFHPGEDFESRETYWAARRADDHGYVVEVFYALAYHDDATHIGDSEWMQLTLAWDGFSPNNYWSLNSAYYSAHFGTANDNSVNYGFSDLTYPDQHQGKPYAWLGEGKHAAYNEDCDFFFSLDECDYGWAEYVEVLQDRNLGAWGPIGAILVNCVTSQVGQASDLHSLPGDECFWTYGPGTDGYTDAYFDGWHSSGDQTMHYKEFLEYFGWRDDGGGGGGGGECTDDPNARKC